MKLYLIGATLLALAYAAQGETINFDADVVGQSPQGWHCGSTGKGTPRWTVEQDKSAPSAPNVLKQSGQAAFPWCVVENSAIEDGTLEVRFKALSGKEDQAAGLVWRWKDGNNYYVAHANALERNVPLYYTENGVRKTIQYVDAPISLNRWHTLKVTYRGNHIQVAVDGKTYIDNRDSRIYGSGKAGIWTKADSITAFDDFSFTNSSGK